MQYGYVKMWDSNRGFGFIVTEDDEELFVHVSDLDITVKGNQLRENQRVAFDVKSDMKGDRAINVCIVGSGNLPSYPVFRWEIIFSR